MTELSDIFTVWGLRVAYAMIVFVSGVWLAIFLSRVVRRQAERNPRIDTTLGAFLSRMIRYVLMIIVVIVVLQMFGVQTASLVAVVGAGALAIGLALQGTLGNVASGVMIALIRPYHIGDFVEINGKEGLVADLDLFFTELVTLDDRRVLVPNGQAVSNPIVNHSVKQRRRCVLTFGVGYEDDLDTVLAILSATMTADPRALADPPVWFGVESLGDSAVNMSARVWVATTAYLDYRADMLKAVKEAFDREGIEMPYPHAVEMSKGEIDPRPLPIKPKPNGTSHPVRIEKH